MPATTTTTSPSSHVSLRDLRHSFLHKLENQPAVDMLQYGNVTLVHKKLDSWIDDKPAETSYSWTEDHKMLKLEHDHLKCRTQGLSKKRTKMQQSWSGNVCLIQRESLIDMVPKVAAVNDAMTECRKKKRTKPRRVSSSDHIARKHNSVCAKDVLLDGDIQTVRKIVLERKLSKRPLLPNPDDYQEGLLQELKKRQAELEQPPISPQNNKSLLTAKPVLYRVKSLDRTKRQSLAVFLMPQST